jgi:hypothetical protein
LDPDIGLRYTRLQSWLPVTMHIGINGRDWLARQMHTAGIGFIKRDNAFTWVKDFQKAQRLFDAQLRTNWPKLLHGWAEESNPLEPTLLQKPLPYYWTVQEGEFATDILFRTPDDLARLYPLWVQYSYAGLKGASLLRYMNYRVRKDDAPCEGIPVDVKTTVKAFGTGTCVRHRVQGNVLKMYDKAENVLRVETLLTDIAHFKGVRTSERPDGSLRYLPLRKGVADMYNRAEISRRINERYVEALAVTDEKRPVGEVTKDLGKRTHWHGRSVRALNPFAPDDVLLLESINRGDFMIRGFRNKDLREHLFVDQPSADTVEEKRRSMKVTRLLSLLRAHGLITKVPKTQRYQVTEKGRTNITAVLAARQANTKTLLQAG